MDGYVSEEVQDSIKVGLVKTQTDLGCAVVVFLVLAALAKHLYLYTEPGELAVLPLLLRLCSVQILDFVYATHNHRDPGTSVNSRENSILVPIDGREKYIYDGAGGRRLIRKKTNKKLQKKLRKKYNLERSIT